MPVALAGKVTFFSGELGGSDGRRPIDAKTKTPNEDYVLCDGIETNGIAIPDLRGLMIVCTSDDHPMGETGGSDTATFTMEGTVGDCTLTVEQMPRHTHGYRKVTAWYGWNGTNDGDDCKPPSDGQPTDATGGSQAHTHALSGEAGKADTLPPYYALSFVMRCA